MEFGDFNHGPYGDPDDQDEHGPVRASGQARSGRIATQACVTEHGARNIVRWLEADGWLKTQVGRGRGGCNTY